MNGDTTRVGIAHQPLRHAVQDEIRAAIVRGRFRPGERLLEDHLAHDLDVSRNPVREALQALALEGFVEIEPRRGARVATISRRKARELFEVREALEGLVSRLAAERRTPAQLAELEELVATGTRAAEVGDLAALPLLNTRFHQRLADAAANDLLAEELARLQHVVEWVYTSRIHQRSEFSWSEHADIVAAIAAQDPEQALAAAARHIVRARDAFLAESTLPA